MSEEASVPAGPGSAMMARPRMKDLDGVRSIVIVKPSSLGDVVHALPAVHLLRVAAPDLAVRWVVNTEWRPLLEGNPDLAGIVEFPRREMRGLLAPWKAWRFRRTLGSACGTDGPPDLAIDLQGLLRSALIARATGARRIVGLSDAREGAVHLYSDVVAVDPSAHAVERYLAVPAALGLAIDPTRLEFPLPAGTPPSGVRLPSTFVALHPWSRGTGKSLTQSQIGMLCRALAPHPVVVVGATADASLMVGDSPRVVDLTNRTTLSGLIAVLRAAAFVVSVDSGPMHIAAALTPNVLGIHTWTDPRRVGPYRSEAVVWKAGVIAPPRTLTDAQAGTSSAPDDAAIAAIAAFVRDRIGGGARPAP